MGRESWRKVSQQDPDVQQEADGSLISKNGNGAFYVEWQEPKARKALLFSYARTMIVNGHSETGNIYGWGQSQLVPISLKKGTNSYFTTGAVIFRLDPVPSQAVFASDTCVVPDPKVGERGPFLGSIVLINTTDRTQRFRVKTQIGDGPIVETVSDPVPKMDSRITPFRFSTSGRLKAGPCQLKIWIDGVRPCLIDLSIADNGSAYRRTFVSRFDGMVHGYSVRESLTKGPKQPIVMFTYGSGRPSSVAMAQFKSKAWCHLISPEYRAYNWDGLARRDALETLEVASKELLADHTRMYLHGHSMGGHGVYQMAALNPKAFAGIGVSAGWLSVFTYCSDLYDELNLKDPIVNIFRTALDEADLEKHFDDLASIKNVSIVHGDKDQSVPISESQRVVEELGKRRTSVNFHDQPGANHSWSEPASGANQYDCPSIFEAFQTSPHRGTGSLWAGKPVPNFWADSMSRKSIAIYGTHGSKEETKLAYERAKKESVIARVAFKVDCEVQPDTLAFHAVQGRNVILFGTPTSNRYWKFHPSAGKILHQAKQRHVRFSSWMIQTTTKNKQVWSAIGGFNEKACRLAYFLNPDDNYRRLPEWCLFDASIATLGMKGIAAAGFSHGPEAWR